MQENQETLVWSLGQEDSLEEEVATHSSILAWRIPIDKGAWWASVRGSQRVRNDWNDWTRIHTCMWSTALSRLFPYADWFLICGLEPLQEKMFTSCFCAQLKLLITWVAQQRKPRLLSVNCSLLSLDSRKLLKVSKIKTSGSRGLFHQRTYNSNKGYYEQSGFHVSDSCALKIPHVMYRPGEPAWALGEIPRAPFIRSLICSVNIYSASQTLLRRFRDV